MIAHLKTLGHSTTMTNDQAALARQKYKRINHQIGVSLIELMIAMVIGLVVSLAIYGVLNVNEGRRRTTTSTNDIDQSGAYTIYQFSKILRSAGSGFSSTSSTLFSPSGNALGCGLQAARSSATVLPASAAFPQPFASVTQALRLAPVIIFPDAAVVGTGSAAVVNGDVLMVMAGSGGLSEAITDFSAKPTANSLTLTTLAGFRANDIVLVTDNVGGAGVANCLVEQVSSTFVPAATSLILPLSGNYYTANVGSNTLVGFSTTTLSSSALNLGQTPIFNMFGVGANNTLFSYDLLSPANNTANAAGANPSVFADNVYAMYAIYGVDDDNNPATTTLNWKLPSDTDYTPAKLLAGTVAANALIQTIKAVKVGIIMQSALPEKVPAGQSGIASPGVTYTGTTATVRLFQDTPAATQVVETVTPTNVRYRVLEVTIPIRNSLIIPN